MDYVDDTKKAVEEAAKKAGETLGKTAEGVKDWGGKVVDDVKDFGGDVMDEAKKVGDNIDSAVKDRDKTKCGLCGAEVGEEPKITSDGKCSKCGAKLAFAK